MSSGDGLPPLLYEELVRATLREDLGRGGDLTSEGALPAGSVGEGRIVARSAGRIAGLEVAASAFRLLDTSLEVVLEGADGADADAGETLARVAGRARSLLAAERTALNFLGHLSGVSTATRDLVREVEGTGARIVCTRKTTPGLRLLEKFAVRMGGGRNHRFGLDDGILIKDNHRQLAGGLEPAVLGVRRRGGHMVRIEVEVDTLQQLDEALALGVDAVLLDNMTHEELRRAVERCRGRALTEASGGIRPGSARAVAETGVDLLSVGWITHSAPSLDVAFDFD